MDAKEKQPLQKLLNFSIINIDKPTGPTSFSVSQYVANTLKINKASHFGTLDPKVTGVLPIALGRACKLTGFFLGENKTYVGVMHVHKEISIENLQKVINDNFLGKIRQTPPKKSNVKREEREREILSFKLLEKQEKDFLFETEVQGGTYIRKLISDLGEKTGLGAHMTELRRTKAGIFTENYNMHTLYELKNTITSNDETKLKSMLIPAEEAIKKVFPVIEVKPSCIKTLLRGKPLFQQDISGKDFSAFNNLKEDANFAIFSQKQAQFIEIAQKIPEEKSVRSKIVARALFVFN
jgi:H/ACA ribonucleoprotein complex subunit 4